MKVLHCITFILLIIGGLNWGLSALGYNVVEMVLGMGTVVTVIYILVGLSAVYEVVMHKKNCRMCNAGGGM